MLAAILGPALAIGAWLLVANSYRAEKRTIITELAKRLKRSDITDTSGAGEVDDVPTQEMRKVAMEMAKWCLWRWDGWSGFRAGSDRQLAPPTPAPVSKQPQPSAHVPARLCAAPSPHPHPPPPTIHSLVHV